MLLPPKTFLEFELKTYRTKLPSRWADPWNISLGVSYPKGWDQIYPLTTRRVRGEELIYSKEFYHCFRKFDVHMTLHRLTTAADLWGYQTQRGKPYWHFTVTYSRPNWTNETGVHYEESFKIDKYA